MRHHSHKLCISPMINSSNMANLTSNTEFSQEQTNFPYNDGQKMSNFPGSGKKHVSLLTLCVVGLACQAPSPSKLLQTAPTDRWFVAGGHRGSGGLLLFLPLNSGQDEPNKFTPLTGSNSAQDFIRSHLAPQTSTPKWNFSLHCREVVNWK